MNKIKTILILFAMLLLMTVAGEVLLAVLFKGYAGKAHLVVPAFFLALYAVPVAVMSPPVDAKQFFKQYFIFKSLKLVLSLGAMLALCFIFEGQATGVLINFLIYCLVMLVIENIYVLNLKNKITKST
jgi:hypothetical protein